MSIGEVAAELASAANNVERVRRSVVTEARRMEAAREVAERAVRGSLRPEPASLLARWEAAARQANQAADLLHTGWQAIRAYLEKIGVPGTPLFEPIKTGEELVAGADSASASAWNRARREAERNIGDVTKVTGKVTKLHHDLLKPAPPIRTATGTPGPTVAPAQHDFPVADIVMGIVAGVVLAAKGVQAATEKASRVMKSRRTRKRQADG
jgi:hypothetical protein